MIRLFSRLPKVTLFTVNVPLKSKSSFAPDATLTSAVIGRRPTMPPTAVLSIFTSSTSEKIGRRTSPRNSSSLDAAPAAYGRRKV